MSIMKRIAALAAVGAIAAVSSTAWADDHAYTEGQVVNITAVRTEYGRFDDYLKYLDSTWKKSQEASLKRGYITGYKVLTAEPRGPNDPDLYLVVFYKNWAALDGGLAKGDEIAKLVEGSVTASNQGAVDRNKMRRIIGSETVQEALLK